MKTKKRNYAVVRSIFGNLWVGWTTLKADEKSIFSRFNNAMEKACNLNDSIETQEELDEITEENCEEILNEKFIVGGQK